MFDTIDGLAAIADRYDGYVFDVWGTLYDGGAAFPQAVGVLERLAEAGKPVVVLSNSPRPPATVAERLLGIGISAAMYREVITSGGESHRYLRDRPDAFHAGLGPLAYGFDPSRFPHILPGTGFESTADLEAADWILNAGPASGLHTVADYEAALRRGGERGLAMICANPDKVVIEQGVRMIHAGALAERYEELGGFVHYHGKPHAPVFERSIAVLGAAPERVLVVGDNRATDVAGAVAAGIDSLLLADGVHGDVLRVDGRLADDRLRAFLATPGPQPRWVADRLSW